MLYPPQIPKTEKEHLSKCLQTLQSVGHVTLTFLHGHELCHTTLTM